MAGHDWTSWLFWIGGGLVALFGFAGLLWALLWDRARGRKRCPKCWYDLSGIAAAEVTTFPLVCSECGKRIDRPRRLERTRRKWGWAIVGVIALFVGLTSLNYPSVQRNGWTSIIPTTALILGDRYIAHPVTTTRFVPAVGNVTEVYDFFESVLYERMKLNARTDPVNCGLADWQWSMLISSCLQEIPIGVVASNPWHPKLRETVVAHLVRAGKFNEWGHPQLIFESEAVSISHGIVHRQGARLFEWEVRRKPDKWIEILGATARPNDAPQELLGRWIPPEIHLYGYSEAARWVISTNEDVPDMNITFQVVYTLPPGFSNIPMNWTHTIESKAR